MFLGIQLLLVSAISLSTNLSASTTNAIEILKVEIPNNCCFIENQILEPATSRAIEASTSLHKGWPVSLGSPGSGFPYTPTLMDIDSDGTDEIFLVGGNAFGLGGDGTFLPGWPTTEHTYMGYATNGQMSGPSCADMDGNGSIEVLWSERDWYAGSAHMWTFNGRNSDGTNMPGFPQDAPDESSNALNSPFVLGDSDRNGNLEAWTAHTLGNTGDYYRISCKDHLGNLQFTTDLDPSEGILNLYFGDADGNGEEEFFAVTLFNSQIRLHLFTTAGDEQTGYPVTLFSLGSGYLGFGPPLVADLDASGDLEIIIGYNSGGSSHASAFHHDGSAVADFPITIAATSQLFYLGLGDVTGDAYPELIAIDNHLSSNYRVHVLGISTGAPLAGWPVAQTNWPEGFPTIVDVDNDGTQDVCFVTDGGELFAYSGDGSVISGYPKMMSASSISGVSAGDIDGDDYYELVASTTDGFVYAWDTDGPVMEGNADWPMRGVDPRNTGVYRGAQSGGIGTASQPVSFTIANNPVRNSAIFTINGSSGSSIAIYNIVGKLITEIPAGSNQINWMPEATIPNGVYFAKLTGVSESTLKFMLVR